MTRIAITGAAGRMGRTLIQTIAEADDLELGAAFEYAGSDFLGLDAGELAGAGKQGVAITADVASATANFDVLVDFSVPAATLPALAACADAGRGIVIGTTGFDADGLAAIEAAGKRTAVLTAPNMSLGVNLVFRLIEMAARAIGNSTDIEILETHHRHKIDAPSGTAVRMGEIVADAVGRDLSDVAVYGREGITGARDDKTIGFATVRAGDIVGEHTVMFAGLGERIEITHRASSRLNFASGALAGARFIADKKAGRFDISDVLGLD